MTPDGIRSEDWEQVVELGAEITNAVCRDDDDLASQLRARLLTLLDELEDKYGERASILSTRADEIEDIPTRLRLLRRALEIAKAGGDLVNQTLTASSLAEIYIEELRDPKEGAHWLGVLDAYVSQSGDESEASELQHLRKELEAIQGYRCDN